MFSIVTPKPGEQVIQQGRNDIFSTYPNPSTGTLTIDAPVPGTFSIFTIDSKLVAGYTITEATTTITLPTNMTPGIYMCCFNGDDGSTTAVRLIYEQ